MTAQPHLITSLALFSLMSAFGQIFVFWTIRTFDALTFSTITTTRKFFTIVLSVVYYGHRQTQAQWAAIGTVFAGLVLETLDSSSDKARKHKTEDGGGKAAQGADAATAVDAAAGSASGVRRTSSASADRGAAAASAGGRRE